MTTEKIRFEIGKVYEATTYYGSKCRYKVIKRAENGYITFEEVTSYGKPKRFARIPCKGLSDECVTIKKGTFGRVCWTGGCHLSACNIVEEDDANRHKRQESE